MDYREHAILAEMEVQTLNIIYFYTPPSSLIVVNSPIVILILYGFSSAMPSLDC